MQVDEDAEMDEAPVEEPVFTPVEQPVFTPAAPVDQEVNMGESDPIPEDPQSQAQEQASESQDVAPVDDPMDETVDTPAVEREPTPRSESRANPPPAAPDTRRSRHPPGTRSPHLHPLILHILHPIQSQKAQKKSATTRLFLKSIHKPRDDTTPPLSSPKTLQFIEQWNTHTSPQLQEAVNALAEHTGEKDFVYQERDTERLDQGTLLNDEVRWLLARWRQEQMEEMQRQREELQRQREEQQGVVPGGPGREKRRGSGEPEKEDAASSGIHGKKRAEQYQEPETQPAPEVEEDREEEPMPPPARPAPPAGRPIAQPKGRFAQGTRPAQQQPAKSVRFQEPTEQPAAPTTPQPTTQPTNSTSTYGPLMSHYLQPQQ